MTYTPYIEMKEGRLRRVGCMKCNTFLYDIGDKQSMKEALANNLPHRVPVLLSDGSYTDMVLCKQCDVVDADLPKLERTMKHAWLYEFIKAGRPRVQILELAKRVRAITILGRKV